MIIETIHSENLNQPEGRMQSKHLNFSLCVQQTDLQTLKYLRFNQFLNCCLARSLRIVRPRVAFNDVKTCFQFSYRLCSSSHFFTSDQPPPTSRWCQAEKFKYTEFAKQRICCTHKQASNIWSWLTCIDAPSTRATHPNRSRTVTVTGTATKKPLTNARR